MGSFLLVLTKFSFLPEDQAPGYHPMKLSCKSFGNLWGNSEYIMFVSNKRTLSYLWWKENLVKHRRVSKYYKNDCLQNFLSYMPLLAAKFVKNSYIYSRTYFTFLKNVLKETWNAFIYFIYFLFIPPYKRNTIKTLLFKLFDKLIRQKLVESSKTLSSSTNQRLMSIYLLVNH